MAEAFGITIRDITGRFLGDGETRDIQLDNGYTYLFFNTHVFFQELIMFSVYSQSVTMRTNIVGGATTITAIGNNLYRFVAPSNCRGFIFKIGNTYGT